jgi:deoxyribodipyrimidine photo-lyase
LKNDKTRINVVWLKRDLRLQDHSALEYAQKDTLPYLILYCFEPSLIRQADTSLRHLQFIYHSIQDLNKQLSETGKKVYLTHQEALTVFTHLHEAFQINTVSSYQESGTAITWDRDKKISQYFKSNNIQWVQFQRDGIVRGISNRKGWDKQWFATMSKPLV